MKDPLTQAAMDDALLRVSVPLRGRGRESALEQIVVQQSYSAFQSPCGEEVVKAGKDEIVNAIEGVFQSPCGEEVVKVVSWTTSMTFSNSGSFQSPCGEEVVKDLLFAIISMSEIDQRFSPLAGKRS